ncbi:hypothetical protein [Chryseobacterium populi]|uniref:Lipoprotein n=1 Tax=Chryseobacterium populi TaxID=1144316 RepID=J3CGK5_9FLAO|nr:hypothetical protein [Chryseobacterium populi]EJL71244.1 hypothetical protein PMI13_02435 [Chryseobacterium populi]
MTIKAVNITLSFGISILMFSLFISSCKSKEANYITYYNKVNKIDSIYRISNKPLKAIKEYRKLFKNYDPKNQERIEEYSTYIILSDQYQKKFGGQKSLYTLLPLIAPYNKAYKDYLKLYQKYGIDSLMVKKGIAEWKKKLNKQLIDSFTIAMIRDQEGRTQPIDTVAVKKNIEKNAKLLLWTFKNYGFPSLQKIGLYGNNNTFLPMHTFLTHMNESENRLLIQDKLLEYVKTGECPPVSYAMMVDNYNYIYKKNTVYGFSFSNSKDTVQIDHNRKSIGLPGLKHYKKIRNDFF